ncbi:MAG: ribosome-binding factor A [Rickettsiales bacterium]|jgi:ribosome-binding factor A|nr:ribosome-binding factor A [Rickettsiales bacterium]
MKRGLIARDREIREKERGTEKTNFQLRRSAKIKKVLNEIFARSNFTVMDKQIFINVLEVDISRDLMNVKAFIDTFNVEDKSQRSFLRELNGNLAGQIKNIVAKMIRMKFVPKITFYQVKNVGRERKILNLLEKSQVEFKD